MKPSSILPLIAALAVAAECSAVNLLTNGTLDTTYQQEITPAFFLPKPASWTNTGARTITGAFEDELSSEPWAGPAPTPVTVDDRGVFFKAFNGNAANGPATGNLFQDVPATPGVIYQLTGWAGAEANYTATRSVFAIDFLNAANAVIGGTELDLPSLFVDNGQSFDYKQYTVTSTAPAGTVSARARVSMIGGTPHPAGGGQAFVVDDFDLSVIPEPTTAVLGLGGLLALLAVRGRHRHTR
jgi:hypothetical protein